MKKIIMKGMLVALMMLTGSTANAQMNNVISGLAGKVTQATSGNSVLSALTGVVSSKLIPTSTQILGTWVYEEPAVMVTSGDFLKNTASSVLTKTVEQKLQGYLGKTGLTKGNMSVTFKEDKTFTIVRKGKTVASGTYTMDSSNVTLTFKGKKNPCKITPQLDNGSLVVVMDATKLKDFMVNIGSGVSQLSTVTSLLKGMDAMKLGVRMVKK